MGKDSALVGKSGEHFVLSELLKRGFDLFAPITDVNGIDFLIIKKNFWIV